MDTTQRIEALRALIEVKDALEKNLSFKAKAVVIASYAIIANAIVHGLISQQEVIKVFGQNIQKYVYSLLFSSEDKEEPEIIFDYSQ